MKIINQARGEFRMVVPFAKFEKTSDGRLMVEGIATSEALDGDNEIMDYESCKAAFAVWPGNIREQHDSKKAVGRALEVTADDATKTIRVKSFVSKGAPDTQEKVMDGTLAAYSIGGFVGERKPEKVKKADGSEVSANRVIVKSISETSLVDAGCNPDSAIVIVKTVGENLVAGDALIEELQAAVVKGTDEQVAEFAKALNDAGLTLADAITLVNEKKNPPAPTLDKVLADLDAVFAGDVAALKTQLEDPALTVTKAEEIAKEYGEPMGADFAKRVLVKAGAKLSAANMDRLQAAHDHLASMGASCDGDADKSKGAGDLTKSILTVDKVRADLDKALADIAVLKAQPVPYVTLRTVTKSEDNATAKPVDKTIDPATVELTKADYILNGDGSVDWQTSRYVKAQKLAQAAA